MVRMPPLPVGQNDHPRPRLPNHASDFQSVLPSVLDPTVRDVERSPPDHAQNLRGIVGLAGAVFGRAARAHLALRQVENARALPALRGFQQRPAAGLLDIVAVRGNGQDVQRFGVGRGASRRG